MGENVGGGSQVCEEGGKLELKLEAISCLLEVESFPICVLLMAALAPALRAIRSVPLVAADGTCRDWERGPEGVGESRFGDISQTPPPSPRAGREVAIWAQSSSLEGLW